MGLIDKFFKKKTETVFEKVKEEICSLSNQNGVIKNPTRQDLNQYLNCLFGEEDQFITLTLDKASNGIRYIQATFVGNNLILQLGLEKKEQTRLVEKTCMTNQECIDAFYQFYEKGIVEHLGEYSPVQF